MSSKQPETIKKEIAALETELADFEQAVRSLQAEREAHQETLINLQAQAERKQTKEARQEAEQAEERDAEILRAIQRKRAALESVQAELVKTKAAHTEAVRASQETRLRAIELEAGLLADDLQVNLNQPEKWQELKALHTEQLRILEKLYGQEAVFFVGGAGREKAWREPSRGLAIWLNSVTKTCLGVGLATLAGAPAQAAEPTFTPVKSLRAALKLA